MEHEINQYLAQQREMAMEQGEIRRDRERDYDWERKGRERRRNRTRPSRFNDVDESSTPSVNQKDTLTYEPKVDSEERYREIEYQARRRIEQSKELLDDSKLDDRFSDRYKDSRRYSRGEDRHRSRHSDDRYGDRYDEMYDSERRSEYGSDRRSGRHGDRLSDRADIDSRIRESRDRNAEKDKPSRTVMLKNLHSSVTDHDIQAILQMFGAPIKDVRLVKHRDTGVSRGFAFVEFQFQPDAQRWMEENQGHIELGGQDTQLLYSCNKDREEDWFCSQCGTHNFKRRECCFKCSISKNDSERYSEIGDVATNVLILMGLDALTTEETVSGILQYATPAKMNISIARDTLTHTSRGYCYVEMETVELATRLMNILASMQPPFQIDAKQVSVHFCKQQAISNSSTSDSTATQSKWPAYDTKQETLTTKPSSDTRQVTVADYQQSTFNPTQSTFNPTQLSASEQYAYQQYPIQKTDQTTYQAQAGFTGSGTKTTRALEVMPADREQYKAAVAQEQVQAARQLQLQQQLQQQQQLLLATGKLQQESKKKETGTTDDKAKTPSTEEVDQVVLAEKAKEWSESRKKAEAEKGVHEKDEKGVATATTKKKKKKKQEVAAIVPRYFEEGMTYAPPDVSTYQYDESSGFYYDPLTGLYYDANSQYYFNSTTQKYLYWDATATTFLPAPEATPEPETKTDSTGKEKQKDKVKTDKNDKNKMAKKLAKDMARWAKSLNSAKANAAKKAGSGPEGALFLAGTAAADAGFAMLMKKANPADTKATLQHVLQKQTIELSTASSKLGIVASYSGGSDSEPESETHPTSATNNPTSATSNSSTVETLTDWTKLICLLCKRQFPSKEILVKHQQFSELHKQNLEGLKQGTRESSETDYQYRDRAKERREKFGVEDPPPKKKFRAPKPPEPFEEPTKEGLKEDNIGNQMLQKMGWNKGMGLGKKQQGRTDPIEVKKRQAGAGLGIKGGTYDITASDTYRDAVKKVMRNRFEEMD